jgi:hypothetical protein
MVIMNYYFRVKERIPYLPSLPLTGASCAIRQSKACTGVKRFTCAILLCPVPQLLSNLECFDYLYLKKLVA